MNTIDYTHTARWKAGLQVCSSHLRPQPILWPVNNDTYSIILMLQVSEEVVSRYLLAGWDVTRSDTAMLSPSRQKWELEAVLKCWALSQRLSAAGYVLANPPCEQWESLDFTTCPDLIWGYRNVNGNFSRELIIFKCNEIWVVRGKKVRDTNGIKIISETVALSIPTVWNKLCEINEIQS